MTFSSWVFRQLEFLSFQLEVVYLTIRLEQSTLRFDCYYYYFYFLSLFLIRNHSFNLPTFLRYIILMRRNDFIIILDKTQTVAFNTFCSASLCLRCLYLFFKIRTRFSFPVFLHSTVYSIVIVHYFRIILKFK